MTGEMIHPLGRQLEQWWQQHADREEDQAWHTWVDSFQRLLDDKKKEWLTPHENINADGVRVFGMSKAGGCTRAASLKLLGYEAEPFSGATRFTFFLGHTVELAALATIDQIHSIDGTQQQVEWGPMKSAIDGVATILGKPTIISVKSTAYKMSGKRTLKSGEEKWTRRGFAELPERGTLATNPGHYAQIQAELAATGYTQGLMVYVAKDSVKAFEEDEFVGVANGSLAFYCEMIYADAEFQEGMREIWQKAWQDTDAHRKPARHE